MPLPNIIELRDFTCSESDDLIADVDRYLALAGEKQAGFHELQDLEIIRILMKAKRHLADAAYSSNPELHEAKIGALQVIIDHYAPLLLSEEEIEDERRRL